MIRTLLVDDSLAFRTGLRQLLEADGRFTVVGEADDGAAAIERAILWQPDLVVMDVRMPLLDGISAAHVVHERLPGCVLVILSEVEDRIWQARAFAAGCADYVLKREELLALPDRLATSVGEGGCDD